MTTATQDFIADNETKARLISEYTGKQFVIRNAVVAGVVLEHRYTLALNDKAQTDPMAALPLNRVLEVMLSVAMQAYALGMKGA
jgi:hypothetical protein